MTGNYQADGVTVESGGTPSNARHNLENPTTEGRQLVLGRYTQPMPAENLFLAGSGRRSAE